MATSEEKSEQAASNRQAIYWTIGLTAAAIAVFLIGYMLGWFSPAPTQ